MLKLLTLLLIFGLLVPLPARQQPFVYCSGNDPLKCTLDDLLAVPVNIFNFLLGLAAVVLLAVIIWAGMRMILYHASEMPEQELASAKMTLTRGIMGFLIIAFSYVLVNLLVYTLLGLDTNSGVAKILKDFGL
ncbi:MAG: hypothetical protein ABIH36_02070 [bacterium]